MYRAPTRAKRKHHPDRGGAKPTWAESTGLKTRHYKGRQEDGDVKSPLQRRGRCTVPANADLAASHSGSVEPIL